MKKRDRSFVALWMAFLMMVTCMFPLTGLVARANAADPSDYRRAYYFSDDPDSSVVAGQLNFRGTGVIFQSLKELAGYSYNENVSTYEILRWCVENFVYSDYQNAKIIFELTQPLPVQSTGDGEALFTNYLEQIFYGMKQNNCSILFICPTEEGRFACYNHFLDYVDMHINTDTLFTFISSFFYRAYQANGDSINYENTTFVFDYALTKNVSSNHSVSEWSWYFRQYIATHLIAANSLIISSRDEHTTFRLLNGVKVVCQREYEYYSDLTGTPLYHYESGECDAAVSNDVVYAVGTTTLEDNWYAEKMASAFAGETMYLYTPTGYLPVASFNHPMYLTGTQPSLVPAMQAFLNGEADSYDNWEGRCSITYKPIDTLPDGWMVNVYNLGDGGAFPTDCWDCIMTPEQYQRYYGYLG